MRVSKQWIEEFLKHKLPSNDEIAQELTLKTVEVEDVIMQGELLDQVVVGEVTKAETHPDADRLLVCAVSDGKKEYPVVCGGSNVREGMLVAFGKIGARVQWHGEGEPVELKKTKIRGVESLGMICAADEIGLGEMFPKSDEKEILDLTDLGAAPGTPLADVVGASDVVFDIDNKSLSNRPDLWGQYGMAREIAAIFGNTVKEVKTEKIKEGKEVDLRVDVKDKKLCPRYMGVVVDGVEIAPSPVWMQQRLLAAGVRPINNVVDVTNYVMMELGQPMHAFDAGKLSVKGKQLTIQVRHAKKGEQIETLDGKEYELSESMLVIADKEKAVAIAGVMGGVNSEVDEQTKQIVLEAATFDAVETRRTSMALGIRTESSTRFEKALDSHMPEVALVRATALIKQLCPNARVVSRVVDEWDKPKAQKPITLPLALFEQKLGAVIDEKNIVGILSRLGFEVKNKKGELQVLVPSWRATKDISIAEDIVEEVLRLYGYEHIPASLPTLAIDPPQRDPVHVLIRRAKEVLSAECALTEVRNYSFVSPELLNKMGMTDHSAYVRLANPIAKDRPLVRRHLVPNVLENIEKNGRRFDRVGVFEVGRVYKQEETGESDGLKGTLPKQDTHLALALAQKGNSTPFFDAADALRVLGDRLGVEVSFESSNDNAPHVHPGRHAQALVGGEVVGYVAEIHPMVQKILGIDYRTAVVEVDLQVLARVCSETISYTPVPQYPAVERDIAFVVEREVAHAEVQKHIAQIDTLITSVMLFDVYEGKGVPDGKKSMAYRIVYLSSERTLETKEVDAVHERVRDMLQKQFGAEVRS